jgi:hypothetical protein
VLNDAAAVIEASLDGIPKREHDAEREGYPEDPCDVFRHRKPATSDDAAPVGEELCSGCTRHDAVRCSYVDKRGRQCPTSWCPDHSVMVLGVNYCRRHASTMTAIEGVETVGGLPDLNNRAPSLVGWMGRQLEPAIMELLGRVAKANGATLVIEPVSLVRSHGGATRCWAKTWKMVDRTGVLSRVSIEVDEDDDCQVGAWVDRDMVGSGTPPWIEHRLAGEAVDPDTDSAERHEFAVAMVRSIQLVVTGREVTPGH